jgi:hypothetical protein
MIGRFQVMATLQAARAYVLGYSLEEAKSFGLNRAIFYAAAKKGFKSMKAVRGEIKLPKWKLIRKIPKEEIEKIEKNIFIEKLGDEIAYCVKLGERKYFLMGDELQTPEDFKKQIEDRFKGKFETAWKEAIDIVKSYDKGVLLSQRYFYEAIYKPRRDELAEKWSQLVKSP